MCWIAFALGWALIAAWGLTWPALPPLTAEAFPCLLLGGAALLWLSWQVGSPWRRGILAAAAGCLVGLVALVAAGQAAERHRWPSRLETQLTTFSGCVVGLPQVSPGRVRFDLHPLAGAEPARRLRLSWYRTTIVPAPGERWQFTAKLRAPRGLVNPGSGDYSLALLQAGIDATASVRTAERLSPGPCAQRWPGLQAFVDVGRQRLASALLAAAGPTPAPSGMGLLLALGLGFQERVPTTDWQVFAVTGVSHLVAISGLHVTLFAALVLGVARRLRGRGSLAPLATLGGGTLTLAVLAAAAYAMLAGGNLPALRTVWMLAIALLVQRCRRETGIATPWAMALLLALLLDPFAAAALGFWLSFGAVGALLWAGAAQPAVTPSLAKSARWRREVLDFLQVQWVVTLVLSPLLAASVGLPGWISFPVNAVAIPLFALLLVPAVLLALPLAACWPGAAELLVPRLVAALDLGVRALHGIAAWPGGDWNPSTPGVLLAAAVLGVALAATAPVVSRRARVGLGALAVALLCWPPGAPESGNFRLTVLDVGQGSAAVVETAGHVLVFDPGPAWGPDSDAGGRVVVPFLRAIGRSRIDAVVVSHADADHAAGLEPVLRRSPGAPVWRGGDAGAARHGRQPCRAGLGWRQDGVEFRFLHPGPLAERDDNAGSCVLWVSAGRDRGVLLLADIPQRVENRLFADRRWPAQVVLVAHHGSNTASGEALRAATAVPTGGHAIVSAGYRNRWGFPKPVVIDGWRGTGRQVWTTAEQGALRVEVGPAGLVVAGARAEQRRWWRPGPAGSG